MKPMTLLAAGLIAAATPAALPAPAVAQPMPPAECPAKLSPGSSTLVCYCPAEATTGGTVWGTDVYTDDSQLCRAALHAGAIGDAGGTVRINAKPGRASYAGKLRHGVLSSSWAAWSRSFTVSRATYANSTAPDYPAVAICPANAGGLADAGKALTCRCPAGSASAGAVWGSGPYTTDSSICRAATHAGRIGPQGGTVSLHSAPGRSSYAGSSANGVSTNDWASYPTSFEFNP